jgi:hypothetical protein
MIKIWSKKGSLKKEINVRIFRKVFLFCWVFFATSYLVAYQPQRLQQGDIKQKRSGLAKKISGQINLTNNTFQTIQVRPIKIKGLGYRFVFVPNKKTVRAKETFTMNFRGQFLRAGKFQVIAKIPLVVGKQTTVHHSLELYYRVKKSQGRLLVFEASSYRKLFLDAGLVKEPGMGTVFKSQKPNSRIPYEKPSVSKNLRLLPRYPSRDSLDQIPTDTGAIKRPRMDGHRRTSPTSVEEPVYQETDIFFENETFEASSVVNARGKFFWLGTDHRYHPAFGWRVRAWTRRNSSSSWKKRAEDWIQWDGKWTLSFQRPSGHKVKFQYVAFNRFFTPQTNAGNRYRWVGPERSTVSSSHQEGSWSANTETGNARGLGEMYHEGMRLWSKIYWTGKINPLRNDTIQIIFPNLTYDCGSGSGNPWSCASTNGRIWLIPAHALSRGVMVHELSHQINYEFWNNNRPPNSGGSHTLTGCFSEGLALLEGFADFMESWLYDQRLDAMPNTSGINLETIPAGVCQSIGRNESYVAATFWDLHDQHFDHDDNLWFVHPGAVPGIYLRTGKKNNMQSFRSVYKSAANFEHRGIIDAIFTQNRNYLPFTN